MLLPEVCYQPLCSTDLHKEVVLSSAGHFLRMELFIVICDQVHHSLIPIMYDHSYTLI